MNEKEALLSSDQFHANFWLKNLIPVEEIIILVSPQLKHQVIKWAETTYAPLKCLSILFQKLRSLKIISLRFQQLLHFYSLECFAFASCQISKVKSLALGIPWYCPNTKTAI